MDPNIKTYLGKRGYVLIKKHFSESFLNNIKKKLTVKPFVNDDYGTPIESFKVYTENANKLYIPKFFGYDILGKPQENRVPNGQTINLQFNGQLRQNQIEPVSVCLQAFEKQSGGILCLPCASGKTNIALYLLAKLECKTLIIVHKEFLLNQWKERIEEFLPGARIGIMQQNKVEIENKDIVIAMLQSISMKEYALDTFDSYKMVIADECFPGETRVITDQGNITLLTLYRNYKLNKEIPLIRCYNEVLKIFEYKIMTYVWKKLYNGKMIELKINSKIVRCTPNHKILTINGYIEAEKIKIGNLIMASYDNNKTDNIISKGLNSDQLQIIYGSYLGNGFLKKTNKKRYIMKIIHIKKQKKYCEWKANMFSIKLNSIKEKINSYIFYTKIIDFEEDLPSNKINCPQWLIDKLDERGLAIWFMDNGSFNKNIITLSTCFYDIDTNNRLINKLNDMGMETKLQSYCKKDKYYYNIQILNIKFLINKIINYFHEDLMYKIGIDNLNKYQWNNKFENYGFIKINNIKTVMKKCYVFDIEVEDNHNFIIGKYFNNNYIQDNNGIIVHNCHHLASRVFSQALRKINCQYMLGLSATPNRKDGLTKVFKWYMGDIIYSRKHIDINTVHVERLIIKSDNEHYHKEYLNFKGKVIMPKMINNICENLNRTRVIVYWIKELLEEGRKILVLSDRRAHLEDINKLLYKDNIKSVGYYVGGMKQKDLDISATKNVILGTSAVAQEGLDITGLDTEILASPKSDIVQAIGRILRKKHEEIQPKIIDIVDNFSIFESQAIKRNKLYISRNYIIDDITVWDVLNENSEPKIISKKRQKNMESKNIKQNTTDFKKQFNKKYMFSQKIKVIE